MTPRHYEMFTVQGDRAVQQLFEDLGSMVIGGQLRRKQLSSWLQERIAAIARDHPEIHDTAVRELVLSEVDALCEREGWQPLRGEEAWL